MTDDRLDWALAACGRVLRPMIRLALNMGVKHQQLDQVMRDLLVEEARRSWLEQGVEPNISQLSVTTGLNRKAVTAKVRAPADALPQTDMSAAAKTVTAWLELVASEPRARTLAIARGGNGHGIGNDNDSTANGEELPSFEMLAYQASRGNVHHRAVLDELVRLQMVETDDGCVSLSVGGFVPAEDLRSLLAFLGDNGRDHLLASVWNTLGSTPKMLERSVFATGLTLNDCDEIQQQVRQHWEVLHHELARAMGRAVDAAEGNGAARIRVGVYAYHADRTADTPPETLPN